MNRTYTELGTDAIQQWLSNHRLAIELGMNVGQLDRDKAQALRIELSRRKAVVL